MFNLVMSLSYINTLITLQKAVAPVRSRGPESGFLSRRDEMRGKICLGVIPLLLLGIVVSSEANVNSLTAGVNLGLDIDHRINKGPGQSSTNVDYNRISTSPSFTFKSDDIKEGIAFTYAPAFKYDLNGRGTDVDQSLNFSARKSLLKEWQIKISELYVNTDDPSLSANQTPSAESNPQSVSNVSPDQISNNLGRRRFWMNNASVTSDYTYFQDSVVSLGYTNSVLRNDGTSTLGFQNYDKHSGLLSVSYRFSPEWKAIVGGQYVRGLYDTPVLATLGSQCDLQ